MMKNPLQELISQRPITGFESPANLPVTVYADSPEVTPLAFDSSKPTIDQTRKDAIDSIRTNFQNLPIPPASPPGGNPQHVQFNDNGAFGGDPGFVYSKATKTLTMQNAGATVIGSQGTIAAGPFGQVLMPQSAAGADAAYMAFHRAGIFAGLLGIDTDNNWKIGGWSYGAVSYKLLHEGNSFSLATAGTLSYGGTLATNVITSNSLVFNPAVGATTVDVSRHINMYGGTFGLNITNNTLNVVANAVAYAFTPTGFTSPGTITAVGNLAGRDFYSNRGNNTAVYYFCDSTRFIYYDSVRLNFNSLGPITTDAALGVLTGYTVTPAIPLDVKVAPNLHCGFLYNSGFPSLGCVLDGFTDWYNLGVHGKTAFWPLFDNAITLGGTAHRWQQLWSVSGSINTSDARQKKNIQDSPLGLSFIESLHPVSYQWIVGANVVTREPDGEEEEPGYTKIDGEVVPPKMKTKYKDVVTPVDGKRTHYGLIAQEVAQAVQASGVVDFGGYVQADMTDPNSELGLNYSEFIAPLIKAVQELSARVKALEGARHV